MQRLLLFDIDQTLIYTAGAGMRCLGRALYEVVSVRIDDLVIRPDGKTDPLILEEILAATGHAGDRCEDEIWRRYARYLSEELSRDDARRAMKPGIPALLDALAADSRACLGLLTGNREETARIKLAAFDLNRYFPVGAFGSDCLDRCALGPLALERACRHFGTDFCARDTWVIGDTDRDVEAARAFGARALAVATGRATVDELALTCADAVLPDLADTERVVVLLLSGAA